MRKANIAAQYGRNLILPLVAGTCLAGTGDANQKIRHNSFRDEKPSSEHKQNTMTGQIKLTFTELRKIHEMLRLSPLTTNCDGKRRPSPNGTGSSQRILGRNFVADAVEVALPSVVRIHVETEDAIDSGVGSGFVIHSKEISNDDNCNSEAIIVTNAHVVLSPDEFQSQRRRNQVDDDIQDVPSNKERRCVLVETQSGRRLLGQVIAVDAETDLAIVKFIEQIDSDDRNEHSTVPMAKLGKSESLRHGEFVVSVGAPLCLENTVTAGIVSNPRRLVPKSGAQFHFIQTDTAINTGNSGGPLVNLDGQVVGINTLKHPGAEGIGYAIPIDTARNILQQLLEHGKVSRLKLGFTVRAKEATTTKSEVYLKNTPRSSDDSNKNALLTSSARVRSNNLDIKLQTNSLLDVVSVEENSAAYAAGLRSGDTVLELNDTPVYNSEQIQRSVGYDPNIVLRLKVRRKIKKKDLCETIIISIKPTI